MHELSIAGSIIDMIAAEQRRHARTHHAFTRVRCVRVRLGAFSNIVPEALLFGFEALRTGTSADGAMLEIETVPARATCAACGTTFPPTEIDCTCTACGSQAVRLQTGEELEIISLEVE